MNKDRFEELMVKFVDGCATSLEHEELMAYVSGKPNLKRELEQHLALKAVTDGWVERLEIDLLEEKHKKSVSSKIELWIGFSLIFAGTGVMISWWLVTIFSDPDLPLMLKIGLGALSGGFFVLLLSVIRWRLQTHKSDRYNEVIR